MITGPHQKLSSIPVYPQNKSAVRITHHVKQTYVKRDVEMKQVSPCYNRTRMGKGSKQRNSYVGSDKT